MADLPFEINRTNGSSELSFSPPEHTSFAAFSIEVPIILSDADREAFISRADLAARAACPMGILVCKNAVLIKDVSLVSTVDIMSGRLVCSRINCPLDAAPPDAGVREPRHPSPMPPLLEELSPGAEIFPIADDQGPDAGVREPRVPRPPVPTISAEAT